jgi:hypothetical protein
MSRNYNSRNLRRGTRPGVAHFAPSRGSRRKKSTTIDPARFVKAADMPRQPTINRITNLRILPSTRC